MTTENAKKACAEPSTQKPPIDDWVREHLSGEQKRLAEDLIAFLRANALPPKWSAKSSYHCSYKNKRVCTIKIHPDHLDIRLNTQYSDNFNACFEDADEPIREFLRKSITYCWGCGTCKPGISMKLLSANIQHACLNPVIRLENPSETYVELAKKLILLRKKEIFEGNAPKVTYIAAKKRS